MLKDRTEQISSLPFLIERFSIIYSPLQQFQMSTGQKNPHLTAISQKLADFDIETQVKRISLQIVDSYFKGNKQAFEYISEWHEKFIDYEARLTKAENYYQNIQINVNSKLQVTDCLNQRLVEFSQEFFEAMQETNQSVEQMRKNYINLVRETGNQMNLIKSYGKSLEQAESRVELISQKIDRQYLEVQEVINATNKTIFKTNTQRILQAEEMLVQFSETQSELKAKVEIFDRLLKDMSLYQEEKLSINERVNYLYKQIDSRVLKSQFYGIREYIDRNLRVGQERTIQGFNSLTTDLALESASRKQTHQSLNHSLSLLSQQLEQKFEFINKYVLEKSIITNQRIEQVEKLTNQRFLFEENEIKKCENLTQLNGHSIEKNQETIQLNAENIRKAEDRLREAESNILSLNSFISNMQKQGMRRSEQMKKLQMDTSDIGNLGQKLVSIGESIMSQDQEINKLVHEVADNQKQISKFKEFKEQSLKSNNQLSLGIQQLEDTHKTDKKQMLNEISIKDKQLADQILKKHTQAVSLVRSQVEDQLNSFRTQFEFVSTISSEVQIFEQSFKKQIAESEQINVQIKEKMEKIMGMFTKLKSDFFISVESLGKQQQRVKDRVKQNSGNLQDVCKYLSQVSQLLNICLAALLARSTDGFEKNRLFKVASLLEGWILEIREENQFKYRGESFLEKMLLERALQSHVKCTDIMKGRILENGKQIYQRMFPEQNSQAKIRKRSTPRRGKSELPKLYK